MINLFRFLNNVLVSLSITISDFIATLLSVSFLCLYLLSYINQNGDNIRKLVFLNQIYSIIGWCDAAGKITFVRCNVIFKYMREMASTVTEHLRFLALRIGGIIQRRSTTGCQWSRTDGWPGWDDKKRRGKESNLKYYIIK